MPKLLGRMDRRLAVTGLVLLASSLMLVIGLVSVLVAVNDDGADLPGEGSLEDILDQHVPGQVYPVTRDEQPDGPLPVRLGIPRINVDAPIIAMGMDADNYPEVPNAGDEVAWYTFTSFPGQGDNAVLSGHVDWEYWGMPVQGVFYNLRQMKIGDEISLAMEDGSTLRYGVTGNVAVAYDDPNVLKVMDHTTDDVITLITCGGTWQRDYSNPNGGNYSHRVIVRAELIRDVASDPAGG